LELSKSTFGVVVDVPSGLDPLVFDEKVLFMGEVALLFVEFVVGM
jgi:hypothetical protein